MNIKIKKLIPTAVIPKYAKPGDAAVDLIATSREESGNQIVYGTGLAVEIPENHVGLLFPRSSICKKLLTLSNSVGVIDSGYRGEIKFVFNFHPEGYAYPERGTYEIGDRIGQLMIIPYPKLEFTEVAELTNTERGSDGYGSSGN